MSVDFGLTASINEEYVRVLPGVEGEGFIYADEARIDPDRLPEFIELHGGGPDAVLFGRFRLRVDDDWPGPTVYENRRTGARLEVIF